MGNAGDNLYRSTRYKGHIMPPAQCPLRVRLNNGGCLSWGWSPSLSDPLEISKQVGGLRNLLACLTSSEVMSGCFLCCILGSPRRPPWRLGSWGRMSVAVKSVWEEHNEAQLSANVTTWCYSLLFPFLFFFNSNEPQKYILCTSLPVWKP